MSFNNNSFSRWFSIDIMHYNNHNIYLIGSAVINTHEHI